MAVLCGWEGNRRSGVAPAVHHFVIYPSSFTLNGPRMSYDPRLRSYWSLEYRWYPDIFSSSAEDDDDRISILSEFWCEKKWNVQVCSIVDIRHGLLQRYNYVTRRIVCSLCDSSAYILQRCVALSACTKLCRKRNKTWQSLKVLRRLTRELFALFVQQKGNVSTDRPTQRRAGRSAIAELLVEIAGHCDIKPCTECRLAMPDDQNDSLE